MSPPNPPRPIYWDVDVELSMESAAWLLEKVARRLGERAKARREQTEPPGLEALEADVEELEWNLESCERVERELRLVALHLAAEEADFEKAGEVRAVLTDVAAATRVIRAQLDEAVQELEEGE